MMPQKRSSWYCLSSQTQTAAISHHPPKVQAGEKSPKLHQAEDREPLRPSELSPSAHCIRYCTDCSHLVARRAIRENAARKINQDPENFNKMFLELTANCGKERGCSLWSTCFFFNWMTQVQPVKKHAPPMAKLGLQVGLISPAAEQHFLALLLQALPCPKPVPFLLVTPALHSRGPHLQWIHGPFWGSQVPSIRSERTWLFFFFLLQVSCFTVFCRYLLWNNVNN